MDVVIITADSCPTDSRATFPLVGICWVIVLKQNNYGDPSLYSVDVSIEYPSL